ncbi:hypothetical protein F5Y19DRAFT_446065 [Xylariaceae sp. FL1651]|nr:hypothetical protein F5Y19DRAFT_446065 [Xylariaceae sp. FL1651]
MALGISSRVKAYLLPKLQKRKRSNSSKTTGTDKTRRKDSTFPTTTLEVSEPDVSEKNATFDGQLHSSFFQKLPLELRKMVYAYVWQGSYDHMYHESNGRHLHFKDGHWVHTRCVMYQEDDEDIDSIQRHMDLIHHSGRGNLLLWQRRLASTWGHRHWRCEERVEHGKPTSIDRTDLGALMVVCKRMHPEVMQSFLECHKLIFNDLFSAYRFLVRPGSSYLGHIRNLDLTLSVPFHELVPFIAIGRPDTDKKNHDAEMGSLAKAQNSRLGAIFAAVADGITCLHSLRLSLDVYDRGPWRKIPERALVAHLERIRVLRGRRGETNYTVELPPALPIQTHYAGMQEIDDDDYEVGGVAGDGDGDEKQTQRTKRAARPFKILRRPALRYWQFDPGEVEHFTWETCEGERQQQHCWIALSKAARFISNPYLIDFTERQ